jgi:CheY-like chemotaxis protein
MPGETDGDRGSFSELAVDGEGAAVHFGQGLGQRQAQTRSLVGTGHDVSSLAERLQNLRDFIGRDANACIADLDHPLTAKQKDATEQVLKSGDHLLSLIKDVLDLASIESENVSLDAKPQDPTPVIKSCVAIFYTLAKQKGLTLHDRTAGWNLPQINIDDTRFKQVLLNLLSNAIKYNRDGGTVMLSVGEGEGGGAVRFLVTDSGRGIAEEKHGQIFAPFSRLGLENSDITGTGIGLTITRELTEAMGGTIGFESTLDLGSTFWLEFPIVSGELTPRDFNDPADDIIFKTKHTVLCIEDNPSSLKLLEMIIGHFPETAMISAHTGELGVNLAQIHRPDVILMDLNLPGIDGSEALNRLKTLVATKNIPVIALTARASDKDKSRGLEAGFAQYLTKPISVEVVRSTLKQAFQRA